MDNTDSIDIMDSIDNTYSIDNMASMAISWNLSLGSINYA